MSGEPSQAIPDENTSEAAPRPQDTYEHSERVALARRTAEYYQALINENVPDDLARMLTRDWHGRKLEPFRYRAKSIEELLESIDQKLTQQTAS